MKARSRQHHALSTVHVELGSRSYPIYIQEALLQDIGLRLREADLSGRVAVVTNATVRRLYGSRVERSLKRAGYRPLVIEIPDGERAKTLSWASKIMDQLVTQRFERSDVLLALGGGVIGDIAGFAASMYLRGMSFVQVATTLVAQVDSSVGGKTGVNHRLGKNLIGAFYQPKLVLMDTDTLRTLPKREWIAGLAEVVKYGIIYDREFFQYLEDHLEEVLRLDTCSVQYMIRRCCEIKAEVVAKDERESGLRRILNYGHTIGHALESLGGYRQLIHGEAVGIGMVQEAELSNSLGLCSSTVVRRQRDLVRRVGLSDRLPDVRFSDLWTAMQYDKKVVKGNIHCVLPRAIGRVDVRQLDRQEVKRWFVRERART
ncbi:MAG: 3-dehydroquinate synthase [Nitrospirales bacterium]|nr:3-dehydroquinate synthase [Nitrospira sp.]MDR4500350.1 3-dehydroquinate synthase [Nitrospirales bacterium]